MKAETIYYSFHWPYDPVSQTAKSVIVTGTFDNWANKQELKINEETRRFEITIPLVINNKDEKVQFKFIVDGNWLLNEQFLVDTDEKGNQNNFLDYNDIITNGKRQKLKISKKYRRNKQTGQKKLASKKVVEIGANDEVIKVIEFIEYPDIEQDDEDEDANDSDTQEIIEGCKVNLFEIKEENESVNEDKLG